MHDFSFEIFCLTVPKNLVGEPFCAAFQKISGSEKVYDKTGGEEFQDISSNIFCLTVPKIFVGGILLCFINFGYRSIEKVWIRGGGGGVSRFSVEIFFVSQCRNISLENTLVLFQKNSFIENFHA